MLVPAISVKTLAKMLLILMMGPADKPLSIPTLLQLTNGYYELQVPGTGQHLYFSGAQIQHILNAMPSDLQLSLQVNGLDLNKLAAYIVSNNLFAQASDRLPREYNSSSSASSGLHNRFILGASISTNEPQHTHNMNTQERNISSHTIAEHTREKNIHELRLTQKDLLHISRIPCKDQDTKHMTDKLLLQTDTSLIDLGYLTTQKLRDNRELLKKGKISLLIARLDRVERLLKRSWPVQVAHGGARQLRMEKYYLGKVLEDPLIKAFHLVTEGGFMEARGGIKKLNELWRGLSTEQREMYHTFLGFNPIAQADYLISKRPDHAQIQAQPPSAQVNTPSPEVVTDKNVNLILMPVQEQILKTLETAQHVEELSTRLLSIADQVLSHYRNFDIYNPLIDAMINDSLQTIKTTDNTHTMIAHVILVNNVLSDLQDVILERPPLLERAPGIIARGVYTFVTRCNPIGQSLATLECWISILHFGSDVTFGKLYLTPEAYQARIDNFKKGLANLSPSKLAQLDAEGWMQIASITLADWAYGKMDMQSTIRYLQTLERIGKTGQQALVVAEKLRKGIDTVMTKNPLVIIKNNAVIRLKNGIDEIRGPVIEVLNSARMLLESEYAKLLAELEHEIATLRPIFDNTRKGFGTFSNKFIKIDYDHILGIKPKFNDKGVLSGISGFHHDIGGVIEKSGIFEFTNKVVHTSGVYSCKLFNKGNFIKDITFFPHTWSRQQVMNAIFEAYDNFKKSGAHGILQPNGKWLIEGVTKEGITIEMYVTQNALITTAYPILK